MRAASRTSKLSQSSQNGFFFVDFFGANLCLRGSESSWSDQNYFFLFWLFLLICFIQIKYMLGEDGGGIAQLCVSGFEGRKMHSFVCVLSKSVTVGEILNKVEFLRENAIGTEHDKLSSF